MKWSRGLEAFAALVRGVLPRLDYQACYFGKVVKFDATRQQVDVVPDDARLETMQGVPLRGPAGIDWNISPAGSPSVVISWENGDPSRPFAMGFSTGAHVLKATWNADQLNLGGDAGAEPTIKGTAYRTAEDALFKALAAFVASPPVAALATTEATAVAAAFTAFNTATASYLATKVRVL